MPKLFNPSDPKSLIQAMVKPIQFRPKPNTSSRLLRMLEHIPFFTGPLKVINDTANAGAQLIYKTGHSSPQFLELIKPLPVISLAFNSLDFVRIPMIFLAALYLKEPIPFTLNNTAKWFYSATFLSLGITALLVPFTDPIISILLAATAFTMNAVLLKWTWSQYQHDKQLPKKITEATYALNDLQHQAQHLGKQLTLHPKSSKIVEEINTLKIQFDEKKNDMQDLTNQQETQITAGKIFDRSIYTTIASMAVAGSVVSLLALPFAPFILIASGLAGGTYLLSRTLFNHVFSETPKGNELKIPFPCSTKKMNLKMNNSPTPQFTPEPEHKKQETTSPKNNIADKAPEVTHTKSNRRF